MLCGWTDLFRPSAAYVRTVLLVLKRTPTSVPANRTNSHRRKTGPVIENNKKNSRVLRTSGDSSMLRRAPVSEMSRIMQSRRHAPSEPTSVALYSRSRRTRLAFLLSQLIGRTPISGAFKMQSKKLGNLSEQNGSQVQAYEPPGRNLAGNKRHGQNVTAIIPAVANAFPSNYRTSPKIFCIPSHGNAMILTCRHSSLRTTASLPCPLMITNEMASKPDVKTASAIRLLLSP